MNESAKQECFDELSTVEQHTVRTYIDELSRRDTLVDQVQAATTEDGEPRDSQIYAIPSAESDRRGALAVLRAM